MVPAMHANSARDLFPHNGDTRVSLGRTVRFYGGETSCVDTTLLKLHSGEHGRYRQFSLKGKFQSYSELRAGLPIPARGLDAASLESTDGI